MRAFSCLDMWMKWNTIDPKCFLNHIIDIMERRLAKVNTLLFVGPSNGGKTLISRSLCDTFTSMGTCLQGINYSFFLENCLNKRVIHHDECLIVPQVIETYKRLMEGSETPVNRKNRTSQDMARTPYVLTANALPWSSLQVDREAFQNRCIIYHIKPCPGLRKYKSNIHPGTWAFEHHFYYNTDVEKTPPDSTSVYVTGRD